MKSLGWLKITTFIMETLSWDVKPLIFTFSSPSDFWSITKFCRCFLRTLSLFSYDSCIFSIPWYVLQEVLIISYLHYWNNSLICLLCFLLFSKNHTKYWVSSSSPHLWWNTSSGFSFCIHSSSTPEEPHHLAPLGRPHMNHSPSQRGWLMVHESACLHCSTQVISHDETRFPRPKFPELFSQQFP